MLDYLTQMRLHCSPISRAEVHQDAFTHLMPYTPEQLARMGYHYARIFEDGEIWAVAPFSSSNGRLFVDLTDSGYADFYCFCSYDAALAALKDFDTHSMTEPVGWHRHGRSGRRRENGDPKRETVYR